MSAADAAWLHMDTPTNPMVVNCLVRMESLPPFDRVRAIVEERLVARFPRFRRRVVDPPGRVPAFEDDPHFDVGGHLHRIALPAPGGRAELEGLVGDLITPPLDPTRPLWHAYLIESAEGAAVLWRIHHCIADGIALGRVLLSVTDEVEPVAAAPPAAPPGALRSLAAVPAGAAVAAGRLAGAVLHEGMEAAAHPDHLRALAAGAGRDAGTAAKLLAGPADPPTALRVPLAGTRSVAWSEPFSLERIKRATGPQRVTVNDLLLTALAAALAEQLRLEPAASHLIHAMVPVNLRPAEEPVPSELGNAFALILLELPVGDLPPAERLREVNSRMNAIKGSHEAAMSFGLLTAMGLSPPLVEERLIGYFTEKASLVVTNVPGPRERLSFAGAPITGVLVWAPCSGSLGMTVSIFSYAGEVTVGFMADTALGTEPAALAGAFERELEALC